MNIPVFPTRTGMKKRNKNIVFFFSEKRHWSLFRRGINVSTSQQTISINLGGQSHCSERCDHSAYLHVELASHLHQLVLLPRLGLSAQLLLEHHHLAVGVEEALLGFPLQQQQQSTPKEAHFTSQLCSFKLENESLTGECVNPANTCFGQFLNLSLPLYFSPQHVEEILHTEFYCKLQHLPQQLLPFIICLKNMCRIWFGLVTGNRFLT